MPLVDLRGRRGLIVGVANEHSIAFGCARAARQAGAGLALSYLNDKARPFVEPCARAVDAELLLPCDVRVPGQLDALFRAITGTLLYVDGGARIVA